MTRYTSVTDNAVSDACCHRRFLFEELFAELPRDVRLGRTLDLPDGRSKRESMTSWRRSPRATCTQTPRRPFRAGMYDHYVPALVERDHPALRF